MTTKKSILITRDLAEKSAIISWATKHNFTLIQQPFISFEPLLNIEIPKTDWIFFSSPNGAKIYLDNYTIKAKKIAALSSGTEKELKRKNHSVDFVGQSNQSTIEIGKTFLKQLHETEKVLFPISNISKKNVSAQVSDHAMEQVIYRTIINEIIIALTPEIIVFTSPSNVLGFLKLNVISTNTKLVAIGETTAAELTNLGYKNVHIAVSTEEASIIEKLQELI